jgi:hypothetical protein
MERSKLFIDKSGRLRMMVVELIQLSILVDGVGDQGFFSEPLR